MKKLIFIVSLFVSITANAQRFQWTEYPDNVWILQYNPDVGSAFMPVVVDPLKFNILGDSLTVGGELIVKQDLINFKTVTWSEITGKPTIPGKRLETYSGNTNSNGEYTVTFSSSFTVAPNIQANIVNGATNQFIRITNISSTGFTIHVFQRNSINILGTDVLLFATSNVNGSSVDVLITEK